MAVGDNIIITPLETPLEVNLDTLFDNILNNATLNQFIEDSYDTEHYFYVNEYSSLEDIDNYYKYKDLDIKTMINCFNNTEYIGEHKFSINNNGTISELYSRKNIFYSGSSKQMHLSASKFYFMPNFVQTSLSEISTAYNDISADPDDGQDRIVFTPFKYIGRSVKYTSPFYYSISGSRIITIDSFYDKTHQLTAYINLGDKNNNGSSQRACSSVLTAGTSYTTVDSSDIARTYAYMFDTSNYRYDNMVYSELINLDRLKEVHMDISPIHNMYTGDQSSSWEYLSQYPIQLNISIYLFTVRNASENLSINCLLYSYDTDNTVLSDSIFSWGRFYDIHRSFGVVLLPPKQKSFMIDLCDKGYSNSTGTFARFNVLIDYDAEYSVSHQGQSIKSNRTMYTTASLNYKTVSEISSSLFDDTSIESEIIRYALDIMQSKLDPNASTIAPLVNIALNPYEVADLIDHIDTASGLYSPSIQITGRNLQYSFMGMDYDNDERYDDRFMCIKKDPGIVQLNANQSAECMGILSHNVIYPRIKTIENQQAYTETLTFHTTIDIENIDSDSNHIVLTSQNAVPNSIIHSSSVSGEIYKGNSLSLKLNNKLKYDIPYNIDKPSSFLKLTYNQDASTGKYVDTIDDIYSYLYSECLDSTDYPDTNMCPGAYQQCADYFAYDDDDYNTFMYLFNIII